MEYKEAFKALIEAKPVATPEELAELAGKVAVKAFKEAKPDDTFYQWVAANRGNIFWKMHETFA